MFDHYAVVYINSRHLSVLSCELFTDSDRLTKHSVVPQPNDFLPTSYKKKNCLLLSKYLSFNQLD